MASSACLHTPSIATGQQPGLPPHAALACVHPSIHRVVVGVAAGGRSATTFGHHPSHLQAAAAEPPHQSPVRQTRGHHLHHYYCGTTINRATELGGRESGGQHRQVRTAVCREAEVRCLLSFNCCGRCPWWCWLMLPASLLACLLETGGRARWCSQPGARARRRRTTTSHQASAAAGARQPDKERAAATHQCRWPKSSKEAAAGARGVAVEEPQ